MFLPQIEKNQTSVNPSTMASPRSNRIRRTLLLLVFNYSLIFFSSHETATGWNFPPTSKRRRFHDVGRRNHLDLGNHGDDDVENGCAGIGRRDQHRRDDTRRWFLQNLSSWGTLIISATTVATTLVSKPTPSYSMSDESEWPLWPALPVAPFNKRRTIRREIVKGQVWTFDQLIGIYYVHVPIRMTVVRTTNAVARKSPSSSSSESPDSSGLLVYAPVAPTRECLRLLQELIDEYGPVLDIVLPSVAVEHKVNAGPFARKFPNASFYVTDNQYSFPIPLPDSFLGLPGWTQRLPPSSSSSSSTTTTATLFGPDIEYEVLSIKPGPGSEFQDVALLHRPSKSLLICDTVFAASAEPPQILTEEPEYTRALLWHARDSKDDDETIEDTPENRRKGWRRIVLLFNFFFPGSGKGDLGIGPIIDALRTPTYRNGWGGWMPFTWNSESELIDFKKYIDGGKLTSLPIIQIILARGTDQVKELLRITDSWDFERVIPMHLDAPVVAGPKEFKEALRWVEEGRNEVRFCDEDVAFLRSAEEGILNFSVFKTNYGVLRGRDGECGLSDTK